MTYISENGRDFAISLGLDFHDSFAKINPREKFLQYIYQNIIHWHICLYMPEFIICIFYTLERNTESVYYSSSILFHTMNQISFLLGKFYQLVAYILSIFILSLTPGIFLFLLS